MKKIILGTFGSRTRAEALLQHLRDDLNIPGDDISYIYRTPEGDVTEVEGGEVGSESTSGGAATGAVVGGSVGALAGLATVAGVIPVIGPIFAAGPIVAALGLGAGAVGMTAAGALTGALAGGIIGALTDLGVSESDAKAYEGRVLSGDVLVVAHAEDDAEVARIFESYGASSVQVYTPTV